MVRVRAHGHARVRARREASSNTSATPWQRGSSDNPQLRVTHGHAAPPPVRFDDRIDDLRWFPHGVVYVLRGGETASLQRIDAVHETSEDIALGELLDGRAIDGWDVRAPDDVWAWGSGLESDSPGLFHFDGARWREQATPCRSFVSLLADAAPAVLLHCDVRFGPDDDRPALLQRRAGDWHWLGLPEQATPMAALARGEGFVVLMREIGGSASTLWHDGAPGGLLAFPGLKSCSRASTGTKAVGTSIAGGHRRTAMTLRALRSIALSLPPLAIACDRGPQPERADAGRGRARADAGRGRARADACADACVGRAQGRGGRACARTDAGADTRGRSCDRRQGRDRRGRARVVATGRLRAGRPRRALAGA
ncbi:MAG: hypothetical protein U0168_23185 [Nannocystaceae bacterium]